MVFALIFGVAVSRLRLGDEDLVLIRVLEQIFEACMRIVHFAMRLAPVAVFAIVFNTAFTFGTGVFASLLLYVIDCRRRPPRSAVRRLLCAAVGHRPPFAHRVLPSVARGLPVRVLDRIVQRDLAAVARRGGTQASPAAQYLALRADRRIDREPERHRALRGGDRALSRAGLRPRSHAWASRCASCSCRSSPVSVRPACPAGRCRW